jgi:oxalate---CoA ligase
MEHGILDLTLGRDRLLQEGHEHPVHRSPVSVTELIAERASRSPGRVALATGVDGRELRYGELGGLVASWWALLTTAGIGQGRRVALQVEDPLSFASSYLGLLAAGVTVLPLDPEMSPARVAFLLDLLDVDLLITDLPDSPAGGPPTWRLDAELGTLAEIRGRLRLRPFEVMSQPALLLVPTAPEVPYGAVPLTEGQLLYVARQVARHQRLETRDRGYSPLPLSDINSQVVGLLATLLAGGSLVLDRRFRPDDFWAIAGANDVTWIDANPRIIAELAGRRPPPERAVRRLRFMRSGPGPLPAGLVERFQASCGLPLLETYGLPEAASQVTANPLRPVARRPGSVGLPVGVQLRVVDSRRRPSPPGEAGSIELRGPGVVSHYLDIELRRYRPARTPDGWLVTADTGHLDEDGFLHLAGRPGGASVTKGAARHVVALRGRDRARQPSAGIAVGKRAS